MFDSSGWALASHEDVVASCTAWFAAAIARLHTYARDEIKRVRAARDPLEMQKKRILDEGIMDASELKALEKDIKAEVDAAAKEAIRGV